ncbi:MAG: 4-hydroxybenzoate octaprenyltransferase [Alphaproteobacteria bacterium]|nr:4-hydroxybenzoate octaprenyltransferase [Alphaproteobacteria bacterium]
MDKHTRITKAWIPAFAGMEVYLRLMRLHQPVGSWLLLWPCWWSVALAGGRDPFMYLLFALGAVAMRSAGCIINDMFDRRLDRQVERTRNRPLASGAIGMWRASLLLACLLLVALWVALLLGREVMLWSCAALPLVVAYPLMKRITWWPQLFLGLTFNWGALVGWVAVRGEIAWPAVILYAACAFWTLGYDTIYAHQDTIDDAKIGVKSTALRLEKFTKPFVLVCYAIFALLFFLVVQPEKWPLFFMVCMALHLLWQVVVVRLDMPSSCKKTFSSNALIGWLPFFAILLTL